MKDFDLSMIVVMVLNTQHKDITVLLQHKSFTLVEEVYASLQNKTKKKHMENIQNIGYRDMQKTENIECTNIITQVLYVFNHRY